MNVFKEQNDNSTNIFSKYINYSPSMVSGHSDTITDLQWNSSGTNLLSVDNGGVFKLWAMKVFSKNKLHMDSFLWQYNRN